MTGHFDVCGPLPTGTTVLEASAGTGKTFTIAALATRYVAEGHAELSELMLVTFGRAATRELRERVRERLVDTERRLADPAKARAADDSLLRLLAAGTDDDVALRRKRLTTALADFDAATIATTHGFCQQMLAALGVAGDFDPDSTFVESVDDLVTEVVSDLYLRKYAAPGSEPAPFGFAEARSIGKSAVDDRHARLAPDDAEPGSAADVRFRLAQATREQVQARKRSRRLKDYDDLLTRLRDALTDPVTGPAAVQHLRDRFRVVLVDEFQDTDPVQWEILRTAFHGHTALVLIGDPKQAIYAFRGGDVVTYLDAGADASTRQTLGRNWRSDAAVLDGLGHLFRGAALGDEGISVVDVDAEHRARRLVGPRDAGVRVRVVERAQVGGRPKPTVGPVRELVVRDTVADIVRLLSDGTTIEVDGSRRPVLPGDIAVLTHVNARAAEVHAALLAVRVPAVLTGGTNVFSTPMAGEWLAFLQALEQPHRSRRVRTAAIGLFIGWDPARLAAAGDDAMDELGPQVRVWADVLEQRGIPALLETLLQAGLPERLLALRSGERQLTDLRQIAESLHTAARSEGLGTAALVEWLQRRIVEARAKDMAEERTRRLESDADAVQVVTVHRSKGLEFPVVYVPFGWDRNVGSSPDPLLVHEDGVRLLDIGGPSGPHHAERKVAHQAEEAGESLRLLYVALTRAQCQVVTWWAPSTTTECSPLHRLVFGEHGEQDNPDAKVPVPSDGDIEARFAELSVTGAGSIAVEPAQQVTDPQPWRPSGREVVGLDVARFDRTLDSSWRRTSYTALTAAAHTVYDEGVASEPESRDLDDEVEVDVSTDAEPADDVLSPMRQLPVGAGFGIAVHAVLERVDTDAADLSAELVARAAEVVGRRTGSALDPQVLATALEPSLHTPLGPLAAGLALADLSTSDRVAEMDFELPLAGGDSPRASAATVAGIAKLLRAYVPADDPFGTYADRLAVPELTGSRLRGYLVGSLDAVLRIRDGDVSRYLVVDYKTNWLGRASAETLAARHYTPDAMTQAMLDAHYPLQLLLYLVALHRFLRWRQPDYDPGTHLGGGLYLFLRGMCGPDTPVVDGTPCGVFSWRPPAGLVPALSDLLAGEERA